MTALSPRIHTLSNGVRVVADPMPGLQTCALSVVVRGGARWEDEARNGWSHLLEHMVFKGAGQRSARDIVEAIESEGGQINAATGYERTSYQVRCLQGGLPLALAVTADLVRRPTLAEADLEAEKNVIAQEIAEAADQPDDRVFEIAQTLAFPGQALGRPILGTAETLAAATPQSLAAYHRALYAPERLVVAAAGAVDEDELLSLAEAAFGDAQSEETALPVASARFSGGMLAETRRLEQAHVVLQLQGVGASDPDYFALRLFAEALGGGMSSRLFQVVREELGLAYAIDAYAESYEDAGVLGVYCGAGAADAARATRAAVRELTALAEQPTPAELARAKAQLKAHLFMALESPLARAEQAAARVHLFDRLITPEELRERIDAVTGDDLRRVGARMLSDDRRVAAVLGPRRAADAVDAFAAERLAA
jgi:predicted Zn-dependent peptidase